jgi:hypothetical protein
LYLACAVQPSEDLNCRSVTKIREVIKGYSHQLKPFYPEIKKYAEQQHLDVHTLTTVQLSFTLFPDGMVDYVTVKFPYLDQRPQLVDLYILGTLQQDLNNYRFPPVDQTCGPYRVMNLQIDFSDWLEN